MRKRVFGSLAVLGLMIPYTAFGVFLAQNGFDLVLLVEQAFGTPGAAFFALDVIVAAVVVIVAAVLDDRATRRPFVVAATLLVGPSCGLPLWLALRQPEPTPAARTSL